MNKQHRERNKILCHKVHLKIDPEVKCACCSRTNCELSINHNNGNGRAETKNKREKWLRAILHGRRTIDDLSLLCRECHDMFHRRGNWKKYFKELSPSGQEWMIKMATEVVKNVPSTTNARPVLLRTGLTEIEYRALHRRMMEKVMVFLGGM